MIPYRQWETRSQVQRAVGDKDGVLEDLVTDESCWREIWELIKAERPRG